MNVTSIDEAVVIIEQPPLGKAGLMEFDFVELTPLTPLHFLLGPG